MPHHQSSEAADVSAWASVAFAVLILFLPALTAANTSSHATLSCIALYLYIFLQLPPQASGLQQNSFSGSGSHRNCRQASVALRGQPAQETGECWVGHDPCLLPSTACLQPVASAPSWDLSRWRNSQIPLLSSPLPNRVQAMQTTAREQSCQIRGLGNQMQFFCFLFSRASIHSGNGLSVPPHPQPWAGSVTKLDGFGTRMVPLVM